MKRKLMSITGASCEAKVKRTPSWQGNEHVVEEEDKENQAPAMSIMGPPAPPLKKKTSGMSSSGSTPCSSSAMCSPVARPPRSPLATLKPSNRCHIDDDMEIVSPSTIVRAARPKMPHSPKSGARPSSYRQPRRITRSLLAQMNGSKCASGENMVTPPQMQTQQSKRDQQALPKVRKPVDRKSRLPFLKTDALMSTPERRLLSCSERLKAIRIEQEERCLTDMGVLCRLPGMVLHGHVFAAIDLPTLCSLAKTSKKMFALVVNYFESVAFMTRLLACMKTPEVRASSRTDASDQTLMTRYTQPSAVYDHLGIVMRTLVMRLPGNLREQLRVIVQYVEKLTWVAKKRMNGFTLNLLGIGRCMHYFTRNWSYDQLAMVWPQLVTYDFNVPIGTLPDNQRGQLSSIMPRAIVDNLTIERAVYRVNMTVARADMAQGLATNAQLEMYIRTTLNQLLLSPVDHAFGGTFDASVVEQSPTTSIVGAKRHSDGRRYGSSTGLLPANMSTRQYAFWISRILDLAVNPLPASQKAQVDSTEQRTRCAYMMNILCAPLMTNVEQGADGEIRVGENVDPNVFIDWSSLCNRTVASPADARRRLGPFARALVALSEAANEDYKKKQRDETIKKSHPLFTPPPPLLDANGVEIGKKEIEPDHIKWTIVQLFALVEETTTFPEPWALESFAVLLLMMRSVGVAVLVQRIEYGHVEETANIICALKTVIYRWRHKSDAALWQSAFVKMFNNVFVKVVNPVVRRRFYKSLLVSSATRQDDLAKEMAPIGEQIEEQSALHWMIQSCASVIRGFTITHNLQHMPMDDGVPTMVRSNTQPIGGEASEEEHMIVELPNVL